MHCGMRTSGWLYVCICNQLHIYGTYNTAEVRHHSHRAANAAQANASAAFDVSILSGQCLLHAEIGSMAYTSTTCVAVYTLL